jgi:hypothetical protein
MLSELLRASLNKPRIKEKHEIPTCDLGYKCISQCTEKMIRAIFCYLVVNICIKQKHALERKENAEFV